MRKFLFAAGIVAAVAIAALVLAASDSLTRRPPPRMVLIASTGTDLERSVTSSLTELLIANNILVTTVSLSELPRTPTDSFGAVVVMNAVDKTKLRNNVQQFLNRYDNPNAPSTVIIATVTGEEWKFGKDGDAMVDAVTQASSAVEPRRIAAKLYDKIAKRLGL